MKEEKELEARSEINIVELGQPLLIKSLRITCYRSAIVTSETQTRSRHLTLPSASQSCLK
jgi:hypothetical protein